MEKVRIKFRSSFLRKKPIRLRQEFSEKKSSLFPKLNDLTSTPSHCFNSNTRKVFKIKNKPKESYPQLSVGFTDVANLDKSSYLASPLVYSRNIQQPKRNTKINTLLIETRFSDNNRQRKKIKITDFLSPLGSRSTKSFNAILKTPEKRQSPMNSNHFTVTKLL